MRVSSDRHTFAFWTAFLGLLLPTATYATVLKPRLVVLATQADSRMISSECKASQAGAQSACSVVNGGWHTKNYECSKTEITAAALKTVTDGILTKVSTPADDVPLVAQNCSGPKYMQDHGSWVLYYSISTECTCQGNTVPDCTGATGLSDKACNVATYNLCAIVTKDNPSVACVAKD